MTTFRLPDEPQLPITPEAFKPLEDRVGQAIRDWKWVVQAWGQETLEPEIRRIVQTTENGLRHIGDLIAARDSVAKCPRCGKSHGSMVCHIDVKSANRRERTGKFNIETHSWSALRNESETLVPAIVVYEPAIDSPVSRLLWVPALDLQPRNMWPGPNNGRGSGDPYYMTFDGQMRPFPSLRCWDGWA